MPGIGSNCHELRIADAGTGVDWRLVYCIDSAAIVVLDVFEKKTRITPKHVIESCRDRYKRYLAAKEATD
jgi:phage-related protein